MTQAQKQYLLELAHAQQTAVEQQIDSTGRTIFTMEADIKIQQDFLATLKVRQDAQVKLIQSLNNETIPTTPDN